MYQTTINPDFNKLKTFFPNLTNLDKSQIQQTGGISVILEYMSEAGYLRFSNELKTVVKTYGLIDHYQELLYLILKKNEQIRERYDAYWQNYNDDCTSKEVANFLLAYKESKSDSFFQLVVKENVGTAARPKTESAAVKDTAIAKWMCEQIYKAIEAREFPVGMFGEKIIYDLFGDDFICDKPIATERLKAITKLSPRKPTVRVKKLLVEFCLYIQVYLINETKLTTSPDVLLTDVQANFFFDILESIGYLDREQVAIPKDYIHAMFNNCIKQVAHIQDNKTS